MSDVRNLLILPHLRIQNANAVSSPMTWGFPAMSAFVGLMQALERKLPETLDLEFDAVGVVCHHYQAQATEGGFTRAFHLTRNPVDKTGATAAIVEEGRIHLDITLIFSVQGGACAGEGAELGQVANEIAGIVAGMRVAGGSVMPALSGGRPSRLKPELIQLDDNAEARAMQFKRLRRRCLPGFVLVSRDDLLQQHLDELRSVNPEFSMLDAWLDLSRLNHTCRLETTTNSQGESHDAVEWEVRHRPGWIVPIPVGYGALSRLYDPGEVTRTRDASTPFRFVESLYSVGQWVSPHRLERPEQLLWYVDNDLDSGLYRLRNDYRDKPITA